MRIPWTVAILSAALVATGCKKEEEPKNLEEAMEQLGQELGEAAKEMEQVAEKAADALEEQLENGELGEAMEEAGEAAQEAALDLAEATEKLTSEAAKTPTAPPPDLLSITSAKDVDLKFPDEQLMLNITGNLLPFTKLGISETEKAGSPHPPV